MGDTDRAKKPWEETLPTFAWGLRGWEGQGWGVGLLLLLFPVLCG